MNNSMETRIRDQLIDNYSVRSGDVSNHRRILLAANPYTDTNQKEVYDSSWYTRLVKLHSFTNTRVAIKQSVIPTTSVLGDTTGTGETGTSITGTLYVSDGEATFSISSDPENGTATVDVDTGVWTYISDDGFDGTDTFVILVVDQYGNQTNQEITVVVEAEEETEEEEEETEVEEETTEVEETTSKTAITLTDADSSVFVCTEDSTEGCSGQIVITDVDDYYASHEISTEPTNGSVTITLSETSGEKFLDWTYVPTTVDFNGDDSFEVMVLDEDGNQYDHVIAITVTPVNDAPVWVDGGDETGTCVENSTEGCSGTIAVTDVDNESVTFTVSTGPSNGTVEDLATGVDGLSVTWTYVPNQDFQGTDSFILQASDGEDVTTKTITITVEADTSSTEQFFRIVDRIKYDEATTADTEFLELENNMYNDLTNRFIQEFFLVPDTSGGTYHEYEGIFSSYPSNSTYDDGYVVIGFTKIRSDAEYQTRDGAELAAGDYIKLFDTSTVDSSNVADTGNGGIIRELLSIDTANSADDAEIGGTYGATFTS
jgi:hypothetical protein